MATTPDVRVDEPQLPPPLLTGYGVYDRDGHRCGRVSLELRGTFPRGRLVIETRSWFVPRQVLVARTHVVLVDHARRLVGLDLARHEVPAMPQWQPPRTHP